MTRLTPLFLVLALVACGGSKATTACDALATCCASGLPSTVGGACEQLAGTTDEAACAQAVADIQAASYCVGISTEKGPAPTSEAHACDRYLSCLLASQPEGYAAALELYGSDSACWSNSAQAAGCDEACDASFADIASACNCAGDSCTACTSPANGTYTAKAQLSNTCGDGAIINEVTVSPASTQTVSVAIELGGGSVEVTGPLACTGATTLTSAPSDPSSGCTEALTLVLTPAGSPDTFTVSLTSTIGGSCLQAGEPASCAISATVGR